MSIYGMKPPKRPVVLLNSKEAKQQFPILYTVIINALNNVENGLSDAEWEEAYNLNLNNIGGAISKAKIRQEIKAELLSHCLTTLQHFERFEDVVPGEGRFSTPEYK